MFSSLSQETANHNSKSVHFCKKFSSHLCSRRQIDSVLKLVLRVIMRQFGQPDTDWLLTLAGEGSLIHSLTHSLIHLFNLAGAHKLAAICSSSILKSHLLPLLQLLSKKGTQLWQQEKLLSSSLSVRQDEVIQRQQALSKVSYKKLRHQQNFKYFFRSCKSLPEILCLFFHSSTRLSTRTASRRGYGLRGIFLLSHTRCMTYLAA